MTSLAHLSALRIADFTLVYCTFLLVLTAAGVDWVRRLAVAAVAALAERAVW